MLALGEATGHAHVIARPPDDLEIYEDGNGTFWIKSAASVDIVHEEHHENQTEPAVWNYIERVVEVNPFTDEARRVED